MSIRLSIATSVLGRYVAMAMQLAGSLILARLIAPAEFGVYGVAVAVINLSGAIREFGITNYLIQLPELDRNSLRRAVGMIATFSVGFAVLLLSVRGWVAERYGEPRLADLIALSTIGFLLMPFGVGGIAKAQRDLQFVMLTVVSLASTFIGICCGLLLAYRGWGAFSLVWMQLTITGSNLLMLAFLRPKDFIYLPKFDGWGGMLSFGVYSMLAQLISQFQSSMSTMLIGKGLGFAAVGILDRANGTIGYVGQLIGGLMNVMYVGLAHAKANPSHLAWFAGTAIKHITGVLIPAYALLAVLAEPVVLTLFGNAWSGVVPIIPILALASGLGTIAAIHAQSIVALARTRAQCGIEAAVQSVRLLLTILVLPQGLVAIAWVQVIAGALAVILQISIARRALGVTVLSVALSAGHGLLLALATALPGYLVVELLGPRLGNVGTLLAGGGVGGGCWCVAAFATRHPISGEILRILRRALQAIGAGSAMRGQSK